MSKNCLFAYPLFFGFFFSNFASVDIDRCTRLFLGDCSSRLSIKIISLASKGRGFSLPLETSGETDWFEGMIII